MINLFKILQLLCIYNKRVVRFIMQCRDLSSDDWLTWKHWNKLKGDASFQPVFERSPYLSLELHPINNLSLVLPHSNRLSILVDTRSLNFFSPAGEETQKPQMWLFMMQLCDKENPSWSQRHFLLQWVPEQRALQIYNRTRWGSPVI